MEPPPRPDEERHGKGRLPRSITTNLLNPFSKDKDQRSPTVAIRSPLSARPKTRDGRLQKSQDGFQSSQSLASDPLDIPQSSNRNKQKFMGSNFAVSSYKALSTSVRDLSVHVFGHGTSPPNRSHPPMLYGSSEGNAAVKISGPDSISSGFGSASTTSLPLVGNDDGQFTYEVPSGWVNLAHFSVKKGMPTDISLALRYIYIHQQQLHIIKPPPSVPISSFDINVTSNAMLARPSTAPASAGFSKTSNSDLAHKTANRHPDIQLSKDGQKVVGGTVEALCHEILFTKDEKFVEGATLTMAAWAVPNTGILMITDMVNIADRSSRLARIIRLLLKYETGLFLETNFLNLVRLLVEKGITKNNQKLAQDLRSEIAASVDGLKSALTPIIERTSEESVAPMTLTLEEFEKINPRKLAEQIHLFHLTFLDLWSPEKDLSLLFLSPSAPLPTFVNPLVFTVSRIHFLTERALTHILVSDAKTITPEKRAEIWNRWFHVGDELRIRGDMAGWLAVAMALFAPPVLRLKEMWKTITEKYQSKWLQPWINIMETLHRRKLHFAIESTPEDDSMILVPEGTGVSISVANVVPFYGDLCHDLGEAYANRGRQLKIQQYLSGFYALQDGLDQWQAGYLKPGHSSFNVRSVNCKPDEELQRMLHHLNSQNQNPSSLESSEFFQLSLGCEPCYTGQYIEHIFHQRLPIESGAHIPLRMVQVMPSYSLFGHENSSKHRQQNSGDNLRPDGHGNLYGNPYTNPKSKSGNGYQYQMPDSAVTTELRRSRSFPPSSASQITGHSDLDYMAQLHTSELKSGDNDFLSALRDVTGLDQQTYTTRDDDLCLKTLPEQANARPTSVIDIDSKRLSQGQAMRDGSRRDTESPTSGSSTTSKSSRPSIAVVAKGATVERLLDILVLGVENFSTRMAGTDLSGKILTMDMEVYRRTFFSTFRSFVSPIVLLEFLKKRLIGAKWLAFRSEDGSEDFPDWIGGKTDTEDFWNVDWCLVAKIHLGILRALLHWIDKWFDDFNAESSMRESFGAFMVLGRKEILDEWHESRDEAWHRDTLKEAAEVRKTFGELELLFKTKCFTPEESYRSLNARRKKPALPLVRNVDVLAKFLVELNAMTVYYYKRISINEWMSVFELLEVQSTDPFGFFIPKLAIAQHEEDGFIQDVSFLLNNLKRPGTTQSIFDALPNSIQCLLRFHTQLKYWFLSQVTAVWLTCEQRSRTITQVLRALGISRKAMCRWDLYDSSQSSPGKTVPSFLASAISTAVVRPESRMFEQAWVDAAAIVTGQRRSVHNLEELIPDVDLERTLDAFTPSVFWLFERMLEIVCFVPNMQVDNDRLINFDKRRFAYNLIDNITKVNEPQSYNLREDGLPFLFPPKADLDMRKVKAVAARENEVSKGKSQRIFGELMHHEAEKIRRDARQREMISRQLRETTKVHHKRHPTTGRLDVGDAKGSMGRRLGANLMRSVGRPISMAFTTAWVPPHVQGRVVAVADLPPFSSIPDWGRPSAAINLRNCNVVACPKDTRKQHIWYIQPKPKGAVYKIQSTDTAAMEGILRAIEHLRGKPETEGKELFVDPRRRPDPLFGIPLRTLCARDGKPIPMEIDRLIYEIERRGLDFEGLYRISGSLASVKALRSMYEAGEPINFDDDRWADINILTGVFKMWMRELPEPIIPDRELRVFQAIVSQSGPMLVKDPSNPDAKGRNLIPKSSGSNRKDEDIIEAFKMVCLRMERPRYNFIRALYLHLQKVSKHCQENKMTVSNLALIFGMAYSTIDHADQGPAQINTMLHWFIGRANEIFIDLDEAEEEALTAAARATALPASQPNSPAPNDPGPPRDWLRMHEHQSPAKQTLGKRHHKKRFGGHDGADEWDSEDGVLEEGREDDGASSGEEFVFEKH